MSAVLKNFSSLVDRVISIEVKNKMIKKIKFILNDKNYVIDTLNNNNLDQLFEYFNSFSEIEKEFFGFPLFIPPNKNLAEFKESYNSWTKEKDSWNVFMLYIENNNEAIAMSYIKKMNHINTEGTDYKSPTWFNSVKRKYRMIRVKKNENIRLSHLMGLLVLVQAEYRDIKKVFARGRSSDKAVNNYLETLGYKKTGRIWKMIKENSSFNDIEYEISI